MLLRSLDCALVRVALLSVLAATTSGCGSDDEGGGGTGGGGGGATVEYSGVMFELAISGSTPLEGVMLCVDGHKEITCATSASDGKYTLTGLPVGAELELRATKDGFVDSATFMTIGADPVADYNGSMVTDATAGLLYAAAGAGTYDVTKASLAVSVLMPDPAAAGKTLGLEGATVTITPTSGVGPVYTTEKNVPDQTLTATTKGGGAVWGGVTPGAVSMEVTAPGKTCSAYKYGWASASGAKGKAYADTSSFLFALCE